MDSDVAGADDLEVVDVEVVDFQDIIESFGVAEDGFLEGFEDESQAFIEEASRAGKSRPVLYIDDGVYDDVFTSRGLGAIDDSIPVTVLPKEGDLFSMLNRFSFGEGIRDVLEQERALFVNPGDMSYRGIASLRMGKEVAQEAYENIVPGPGSAEYLENQRGVGVMYLPSGGLEVQVDEDSLGRDFDYAEDDSLVLHLGEESVELEYDQIQSSEVDGRYKFVVE